MIDKIVLTNVQCLLVLLGCVFIILTNRVEWALGCYLGLISFGKTVLFGPIALFWVLAATLVIGTTFEYLQRPKNLRLIEFRDKWIVPWMAIWWFFTFVLICVFNPFYARILTRNLLMYIILPIPCVLLFADKMTRVKGFAWGFILITIANGFLIFTISGVISEPIKLLSLMERGLNAQIWIHNYHRIGAAFGISVILLYALLLSSRPILIRVCIIMIIIFMIGTLYFINSHQMLIACLISSTVFFLWSLFKLPKRKLFFFFFISIVMLATVILFGLDLKMLVRNDLVYSSEGLSNFWNARSLLWAQGFQEFIASPIWGNGFQVNAHNLFLSTLAAQGLIGLIFLAGFLLFIAIQFFRMWKRKIMGEHAIWFVTFQCIIMYGLIHSQVSGGPLDVWHLYWASAFFWTLVSSREAVTKENSNSLHQNRHLNRRLIVKTT